ncbi:hypothetical protein BDK51DRAFT_48418 [Blyttiomyces helicus]|uniref:Uncharacterized protein n=1 Tax=Blyttiomyces helicus TaxID=388810 RepID=A0A4P9VWU0_9FUNG|nr:hypothetical protein BDK51DRAFT_48418 [Blyttiomyces helicus]|eukprot:RKO84181.1 hypothetical protein BDK51DRAFT_48418 [Blyttiomyces helicus]
MSSLPRPAVLEGGQSGPTQKTPSTDRSEWENRKVQPSYLKSIEIVTNSDHYRSWAHVLAGHAVNDVTITALAAVKHDRGELDPRLHHPLHLLTRWREIPDIVDSAQDVCDKLERELYPSDDESDEDEEGRARGRRRRRRFRWGSGRRKGTIRGPEKETPSISPAVPSPARGCSAAPISVHQRRGQDPRRCGRCLPRVGRARECHPISRHQAPYGGAHLEGDAFRLMRDHRPADLAPILTACPRLSSFSLCNNSILHYGHRLSDTEWAGVGSIMASLETVDFLGDWFPGTGDAWERIFATVGPRVKKWTISGHIELSRVRAASYPNLEVLLTSDERSDLMTFIIPPPHSRRDQVILADSKPRRPSRPPRARACGVYLSQLQRVEFFVVSAGYAQGRVPEAGGFSARGR